jgi:NAD+ kinase
MPVSRIGLVVHTGQPAANVAAERVRRWAARHTVPCAEIDVWHEGGRLVERDEAERAGHPDLVVTIGGDGTLLRGVRVAAPIDALVLGVDVGRVGYLTEVKATDIAEALDAVHRGKFTVDARMTLTMRASRPLEMPDGLSQLWRYGRGPALPPPRVRDADAASVGWGVHLDLLALNDVVFEKLVRDRQASLAVYVSGRLLAFYSADAVIVSSSTGSTAYSFSAGGPIASPNLDALIFTPVAPHMSFNRSLVLSTRERLGVQVLQRSGQVVVSVDGQPRGVLDPGDWLSVFAGRQRARLVRLTEQVFLDRLRDKLGLTDAAAALADGSAPAIYAPAEPLPEEMADPGPRDSGQ